MDRRLVCPRYRDEPRVGSLVDALEASVASGSPPLPPEAPVPADECSKLSYFHSERLPAVSARGLMRALVSARIYFDWATVAIAVSLVQRFRCLHGKPSVTPHMLHRLLIGFLVVGAKAHQDRVPTNRLVAEMVGMTKAELARIEARACRALNWRVQVHHDHLVQDEAVLLCAEGCSVRIDGRFLDASAEASDEVATPTGVVAPVMGHVSPASHDPRPLADRCPHRSAADERK